MLQKRAAKWVVGLVLGLPAPVLAVPFTEIGDAGSTIPFAQNLGPVNGDNSISGNLTAVPFDPYDADIYKIVIGSVGPLRPVYISTFPDTTPVSGGGTLDTMLQLFDGSGKGIVGNDDIVFSANTDSYLTAMLPAGTYYLAISGFQYAPQDIADNNIFPAMNGSGLAPANLSAGQLHHYALLNDQGYTAGPYNISVIVPEPGTLLLLAAGLLGLAGWNRRKSS